MFSDYKFVSSNDGKLKEYRRFGVSLTFEKGKDLDEVNGTPMDVIIHKAKDAGAKHIIEDTSLDIAGEDVGVNVRWLLDQLLTSDEYVGKKATWTVLIGVNTGTKIMVFEGAIKGTISKPKGEGMGFDPIFVPEGSSKTLAEMTPAEKDMVSARKIAIDNLLGLNYITVKELDSIPEWTGDYQ